MKLAKMAAVLPLLALAPAVSYAGATYTEPVAVDATARWARGALGSARNTADTTQYIYCIAYSYGYTFCAAQNSAGITGSCGSSSATYANVLSSLNSDSYVYFSWDASGTCTNLIVENDSFLDPKKH